MASLQDRVIGAMRMRAATFEEVERDTTATPQAALVVLAASAARGVGAYYLGPAVLVGTMVSSAVAWLISALVLWIVGTRVLPGRQTEADFGQLLRTVGFAQAPGLFAMVILLPVVGPLLSFLVYIWVLAATVVAVRQALDYDDTLRAVIVCVIAWIVMLGVMMIGSLMGFGARVF